MSVMPRAIATAALTQVCSSTEAVNGCCTRARPRPAHNKARWATKAAVVRKAEAATASTPVLIKGLSIKVATD